MWTCQVSVHHIWARFHGLSHMSWNNFAHMSFKGLCGKETAVNSLWSQQRDQTFDLVLRVEAEAGCLGQNGLRWLAEQRWRSSLFLSSRNTMHSDLPVANPRETCMEGSEENRMRVAFPQCTRLSVGPPSPHYLALFWLWLPGTFDLPLNGPQTAANRGAWSTVIIKSNRAASNSRDGVIYLDCEHK